MSSTWEDLREPPSRSARWKATLRKQPSAILLAAQVLLADQALVAAIGPAVLGGLVYAGLLERRLRRVRQPDASP